MNQVNPVLPAPPPISSQKEGSEIPWMREDSFLDKLWRNAKARYSLGILLAMIAVGIAGIPKYARLTRGATLSVKSSGYVEASRALGTSNARILLFQILPNIMSPLLVYTTLQIGIAILDTAGLSFIGLGAQPPTPEWGTMLSEGKEYIHDAWWLATFPGISITLVVFTVNILGDALRDIFDPKSN